MDLCCFHIATWHFLPQKWTLLNFPHSKYIQLPKSNLQLKHSLDLSCISITGSSIPINSPFLYFLSWSSAAFSTVSNLSTLTTVVTFIIIYFTTITLRITFLFVYTFKFIHHRLHNGYFRSQIFTRRKQLRNSRIFRHNNFIHLISLPRSLTLSNNLLFLRCRSSGNNFSQIFIRHTFSL